MPRLLNLALISSLFLLPCLTATTGGGDAAEPAVSGPSLGLVFDSATRTLRPIRGIPGAALLGDPVAPDFGIAALAVAESAPDSIVFNASGTSAALYFGGAGRVGVIDGFAGTPRLAREIDVSTLSTPLGPLALSSDGALLVAAVREADTAAVYLIAAGEPARRIGSFQSVTALSFAGDGSDVLIADGTANAVYLIQDAAAAAVTVRLAAEQDGLAHPVGLAATADGMRLLVANDGNATVTIIDRNGGASASVSCACKPTGLARLGSASVFALTEPSAGPVWIIAAAGPEVRVLAVPEERFQIQPTAAVGGDQK